MTDELREKLAAYAHEAWSGRQRHLFSKSVRNAGNLFVPRWLVERMTRQVETPYADLPEGEKESDRAEADKILKIVGKHQPLSIDMGRCEKFNKIVQALGILYEHWVKHGSSERSTPELVEKLMYAYDEWLD